MKRLYYELWADAIEFVKNTDNIAPKNERIIALFLLLCIAEGSYLAILLIGLSKYLGFDVLLDVESYIKHIAGDYLGDIIFGFVVFFSPFILINYYFLCYQKHYLKYMRNRKINTGGKALFIFIGSSVVLFLTIVTIGALFYGW